MANAETKPKSVFDIRSDEKLRDAFLRTNQRKVGDVEKLVIEMERVCQETGKTVFIWQADEEKKP